jgi:hypothetical protein
MFESTSNSEENAAIDGIVPLAYWLIRLSSLFCPYVSLDFSEEPTEASADEIRMEAEKWVNRSKCGASVVVTVFLAWVIFAQVFRSHLPTVLYLYNYDNAELTGW